MPEFNLQDQIVTLAVLKEFQRSATKAAHLSQL